MKTFEHTFDRDVVKGDVKIPLGNFIDGKFVDGSGDTVIEIINPSTEKLLTVIPEGSPADVDAAVIAARKAFDTVWGLHTSGDARGHLLYKLAELMEEHADRLAAVEALDVGKAFAHSRYFDIDLAIRSVRYFAGWADKNHGKLIEVHEGKLAYSRHEPIGVCGQIIPWNCPTIMFTWKVAPALATGNTVVLKPSELTPLTSLYMAKLISEVGFPPGVVNVVNGYGNTVGEAISAHLGIDKIAFTGSAQVGRRIMEAAARSNLKPVNLELGGKGPSIVFADADLNTVVDWVSHGIFFEQGQVCMAGSRIFVQDSIYEEFLNRFTAKAKSLQVGDPFVTGTYYGPQVSRAQFDRVMSYIRSGQDGGAKVLLGGDRKGDTGYYINATVFTDTKPEMRIVQEEIFGPVVVVIKFNDETDVLRQANDTTYGLSASVFTQDITRALTIAHQLNAGTVWVNSATMVHPQVPFGGYKQSGIGRESGEYALANYTNVKAVHVNLGLRAP